MLSFIFYCKKWSGKRGSNSRPRPWQGRALPTELFPHLSYFKMVPEARLELARPERRGILNPLRLPIPPLGQRLNYQRCELMGRIIEISVLLSNRFLLIFLENASSDSFLVISCEFSPKINRLKRTFLFLQCVHKLRNKLQACFIVF